LLLATTDRTLAADHALRVGTRTGETPQGGGGGEVGAVVAKALKLLTAPSFPTLTPLPPPPPHYRASYGDGLGRQNQNPCSFRFCKNVPLCFSHQLSDATRSATAAVFTMSTRSHWSAG